MNPERNNPAHVLTDAEIWKKWQAKRRAHDRRWCYLMVAAIAVGIAMPFPLNTIQVGLCLTRLVQKIFRLMGV